MPPADFSQVAAFVAVFKNGNTAENYINHVMNGCKVAGVSTSWHDDRVRQLKISARMKSSRLHVVGRREILVVSWESFSRIVTWIDKRGQILRAVCWLTWWSFGLRVQSEGLVLWVGNPVQNKLLQGRQSARWVEDSVCS